MIRVYLDTCSIQRPLDTLDQTRLRLEAEAVLGILERVRAGTIELVSSTILEMEVLRNPHPVRREHGEQVLSLAASVAVVNESVARKASVFVSYGVKATDALHLAVAEASSVDYFCTYDDRFLRRAQQIPDLHMVVISPLPLIEGIEP